MEDAASVADVEDGMDVDEEDVVMEDAENPATARQQAPTKTGDTTIATKMRSFVLASPEVTRNKHAEEVGESPADAPGSGRRQRVRVHDNTAAIGSSTLLQRVLEELDETVDDEPASSPLTRKSYDSRQQAAKASRTTTPAASVPSPRRTRRSPRLSGGSVVAETEEVRESSPPRLASSVAEASEEEIPDDEPIPEPDVEEEEEAGEEPEEVSVEQPAVEEPEEEQEEAQPIEDAEAAKRIGKKRPRRSLATPGSPDLSSGAVRGEEEAQAEEPQPAAKRRRRREQAASPAQQQQPKTKPKSKPPPPPPPPPSPPPATVPKPKPKPKQTKPPKPQARPPSPPVEEETEPAPSKKKKGRPKQQQKPREEEDNAEDEDSKDPRSFPVTVQRFVGKPVIQLDEDDDDDENASGNIDTEILNAEIPYANRPGANPVDVLKDMFVGYIERYMTKLSDPEQRAQMDAAARRENKAMRRALDAFRIELETRLLGQTGAVDNLYALRKQVRAAQKEKLALREEIARVRREREQVALRIDALRSRHGEESKEALVSNCMTLTNPPLHAY